MERAQLAKTRWLKKTAVVFIAIAIQIMTIVPGLDHGAGELDVPVFDANYMKMTETVASWKALMISITGLFTVVRIRMGVTTI